MSVQISVWEVLILLSLHWLGDFVGQTDKQAKGKSESWQQLLSHTGCYTAIFLIPVYTYARVVDSPAMILFLPITFAAHTATDYYTSRVNSQLYKEGKTHEFFVSMGFDQLLHFAQLIITFQLLK